MTESDGINRRKNIRFRDPDNTVVHLVVETEDSSQPLLGLIINESFKGLACVYVGVHGLKKGSIITWKEAENIETPCEVVRCKEIEESVFMLALKIKD